MEEKTQVPISKDYGKNIDYLLKELRVEKNFDVVHRKLEFAERKFGLFFVDGFAKDVILIHVLRELSNLSAKDLAKNPVDFLVHSLIPHIEVETSEDLEEVMGEVLAGQAVLIAEGLTKALLIDTREYPARSPEEPDIERVVRGPRDGFVETIVFNAALIRRRVRDRSLIMEPMQVGKRSKTDIIVTYIDSIADQKLVETIKKKLSEIKIDSVIMSEKTIEEFLFGNNMNPYPLVRYTERADTASVQLMEGHILILVDGSPSIIICPSTFWHQLEHAEEYRQKPIVGAFLRWVRFVAILVSLFLLPLWYVFATNQELLAEGWKFIGVDDPGNISLIWQFFLAEIGVEILRMAAIHTPNALATALGLVAAILIGQIAVEVGLFTSEVILYLAVALMGTYATSSYELSLANRMFRLFFLFGAALFGPVGFVVAITLWVILLTTSKTLNTPYLWPFIPFDAGELYEILVRSPIPLQRSRPKILNVHDPDRMP